MISSSASQIPSPSESRQTGLPSILCAPRARASAINAGSTGTRNLRLGASGANRNEGAVPFNMENAGPEIAYVCGEDGAGEAEFRIEKGSPKIA